MSTVKFRSSFQEDHKEHENHPGLISVGELVTSSQGFMRGHGTFVEDGNLYSSVLGVVQKINKLVSVKSNKHRYIGEVGDVVIGRVISVEQRKWKLDTYSRLDSVLPLASVNLPGGEKRRKTEDDERAMRVYLSEGDLVSAEVQNVHHDGALSLHTRSLRYGKLGQGILIRVCPSLIKRGKIHFHSLPMGATVIIGNNGFIWIEPTRISNSQQESGGFETNTEAASMKERQDLCRLRNCIDALQVAGMLIFDTSILYAYDSSLSHEPRDLLNPIIQAEIVELTRQRLERG